jgi:hypothetical protein
LPAIPLGRLTKHHPPGHRPFDQATQQQAGHIPDGISRDRYSTRGERQRVLGQALNGLPDFVDVAQPFKLRTHDLPSTVRIALVENQTSGQFTQQKPSKREPAVPGAPVIQFETQMAENLARRNLRMSREVKVREGHFAAQTVGQLIEHRTSCPTRAVRQGSG